MAGSGWRDFATGEVVTEAVVQGYLMDQAVMVFATAAARNSALASPSEGMISYLSDNNRLEYYDGASWKVYPGDPTAAGSIPFFTGTTWSKVAATTAGDVIYFDGTNWQRLAIGTAGQALSVNAGATAPEWATVAGGFNREGGSTSEATTSSTSAVDVRTVSSLNIAAGRPLLIAVGFRKVNSLGTCGIGLKINSTTVWEATAGASNVYNDSTAGNGYAVFHVPPGVTNYGTGFVQYSRTGTTPTSGSFPLLTAVRPAATVTSIAIRGIVSVGTESLAIGQVHVYSLRET